MQAQRYTNGVLTAIAALLGLHLVGQASHHTSGAPEASIASATQPEQYRRDGAADRPTGSGNDPTEGGLVSAAEQRKIMIFELRNISARLSALETRLGEGLNVNVLTMPQQAAAPAEAAPSQQASTPAP